MTKSTILLPNIIADFMVSKYGDSMNVDTMLSEGADKESQNLKMTLSYILKNTSIPKSQFKILSPLYKKDYTIIHSYSSINTYQNRQIIVALRNYFKINLLFHLVGSKQKSLKKKIDEFVTKYNLNEDTADLCIIKLLQNSKKDVTVQRDSVLC